MPKKSIIEKLEKRIEELENEAIIRKEAEIAFKESEKRYRALFNNASDAIFIHEIKDLYEGTSFVDVNQVACDRYGYSRDELFALGPKDIIPSIATKHFQNLRKQLKL